MAEWEAFYYFEPWGAPVQDQRAFVMAGLHWHSAFKGDMPDFFDRDPEETARLEAKHAASITLEDKVHALFGPMAAAETEEPPLA